MMTPGYVGAESSSCCPGALGLARILALVVALGAVLIATSAQAHISCNSVSGGGLSLDAGNIPAMPRGVAAGSIIKTFASSTYIFECGWVYASPYSFKGTNTVTFGVATVPVYGSDVYATGIPGLGARYKFNSTDCGASNVTIVNGAAKITCSFTGSVKGSPNVPASITVAAELVVTGTMPVGTSSLTKAPVVTASFRNSDYTIDWPQANLYTGATSGSIRRAACGASTTSQTISLPKVGTTALSGAAGTTAIGQGFVLALACDAGAAVSLVLSDNVNQANRSNVLTPTAGSTATGVGIQILKNGTPVSFGPDAADVGTTNQWVVGQSPNGMLEIPLMTRYVRITGTLKAGTINGIATFTMAFN